MSDVLKMAREYWTAEEALCNAAKARVTREFEAAFMESLMDVGNPVHRRQKDRLAVEMSELETREKQITAAKVELKAAGVI